MRNVFYVSDIAIQWTLDILQCLFNIELSTFRDVTTMFAMLQVNVPEIPIQC